MTIVVDTNVLIGEMLRQAERQMFEHPALTCFQAADAARFRAHLPAIVLPARVERELDSPVRASTFTRARSGDSAPSSLTGALDNRWTTGGQPTDNSIGLIDQSHRPDATIV